MFDACCRGLSTTVPKGNAPGVLAAGAGAGAGSAGAAGWALLAAAAFANSIVGAIANRDRHGRKRLRIKGPPKGPLKLGLSKKLLERYLEAFARQGEPDALLG